MEKIQPMRMNKLKVNVLKSSENEMKLEVEGAGHSLLNVLQKTLLEDEKIDVAGYHVPHPLIDSGILYVQTRKRTAFGSKFSKGIVIRTETDNGREAADFIDHIMDESKKIWNEFFPESSFDYFFLDEFYAHHML